MTHQIESAAFVAENVAPSSGARGAAVGIAAESHRPRAGDADYSRFTGGRARKRDQGVVGDRVLFRSDDFARERFLVGGAAAEAETGGSERGVGESGATHRF